MVVPTFFKTFTYNKKFDPKMHIAHHLHPIQQQHLLLLQLCCELMCLMLKGSRVCKTQGRSYPPPPQMEYCVCVYEFTNSWRAGTLTADASQLCSFKPKQAASLDTQGLGRRTKCPIKGDPYILLLWADACLLLYNCLSPNNHTKAFPKWPKLFGINKPFPPCWSRLCTHHSVTKLWKNVSLQINV